MVDPFQVRVTRPEKTDPGIGLPAGWVSEGNLYGLQTITTPGTRLYRKTIFGWVDIKAAGVTVEECDIRGPQTYDYTTAANLITCYPGLVNTGAKFIRNRLVPDVPNHNLAGIVGYNYTATRNLILNTVDGFGSFNIHDKNPDGTYRGGPINVELYGNHVSELAFFTMDAVNAYLGTTGVRVHPSDTKTHNDAWQLQGGQGAVAEGNAFYGTLSTDPKVGKYAGTTLPAYANASVQFNKNVGPCYDNRIRYGWVNGGAYMFNLSGAYDAARSLGDFSSNRWGRLAAGGPGAPRALVFPTGSTRGTNWTEAGNTWDPVGDALDGQPITIYVNG